MTSWERHTPRPPLPAVCDPLPARLLPTAATGEKHRTELGWAGLPRLVSERLASLSSATAATLSDPARRLRGEETTQWPTISPCGKKGERNPFRNLAPRGAGCHGMVGLAHLFATALDRDSPLGDRRAGRGYGYTVTSRNLCAAWARKHELKKIRSIPPPPISRSSVWTARRRFLRKVRWDCPTPRCDECTAQIGTDDLSRVNRASHGAVSCRALHGGLRAVDADGYDDICASYGPICPNTYCCAGERCDALREIECSGGRLTRCNRIPPGPDDTISGWVYITTRLRVNGVLVAPEKTAGRIQPGSCRVQVQAHSAVAQLHRTAAETTGFQVRSRPVSTPAGSQPAQGPTNERETDLAGQSNRSGAKQLASNTVQPRRGGEQTPGHSDGAFGPSTRPLEIGRQQATANRRRRVPGSRQERPESCEGLLFSFLGDFLSLRAEEGPKKDEKHHLQLWTGRRRQARMSDQWVGVSVLDSYVC
ncbi:hypothetical protein CSOJ01_11447 [Colletotrichum sojae]|uniref:Uncharacterized protein n=1 Tax=Colletotrichum sojae TaxID=2175907 RepID=A0A8H6IY57_9PEZI|nr:hypothetical protein CSOJ01_11447 [Colletotrichum sojae]